MTELALSLLGEFIAGLASVPWLQRLRAITTLRRCEARIAGKGMASLRPATARAWQASLTDAQTMWFEYGLSAHRARIDSCVESLQYRNT